MSIDPIEVSCWEGITWLILLSFQIDNDEIWTLPNYLFGSAARASANTTYCAWLTSRILNPKGLGRMPPRVLLTSVDMADIIGLWLGRSCLKGCKRSRSLLRKGLAPARRKTKNDRTKISDWGDSQAVIGLRRKCCILPWIPRNPFLYVNWNPSKPPFTLTNDENK